MATSSIKKNFIINTPEQAEMFANAIEKSYQESLTRKPKTDIEVEIVTGQARVEEFWKKWEEKHAK